MAADGSKPEQPALAKAPLAEARSESAPEILPPVVRDPARIPEILRIGPPSSRAGAPEAEEVAAVGESATPVESLRVSIDAEPNALVRVNGELLGITPIPAAELSSGLHSFSIEFESGQVSERSVRVDEANQSFLFRLVPTGSRSPLPPGG